VFFIYFIAVAHSKLVYKDFLYFYIDSRLFIKNVCQMLVMLGQNVYQDDFQRHFLKVSAEFYKVSLYSLWTGL